MKLIHTADWHLGKRIHGVYMTDDQRYILRQLAQAVEQEKPDAVIVAGDLYDRAVPPTEAVELLNDILETIVLELNTPVLAIAGNHDSPDRLQFGSRLMKARGLHLVGTLRTPIEPVVLHDSDGAVHFHLVPYADPAFVREQINDETIRTHDDAMRAITDMIWQQADRSARHVFVGHAFVTPGAREEDNTSDAERPLSIGGAEYVSAEYFERFDYAAFGHLHRAHRTGADHVRYAGSPLKYSISEAGHHKGYTIVELDKDGHANAMHCPLHPLRDMRKVEATMEQILQQEPSDDYVFVTLKDNNPVLHPMEKIRSVYPNALHIERQADAAQLQSGLSEAKGIQTRERIDPVRLFASFYREVSGSEWSNEKEQYFVRMYEQTLREEAEHS